MWVQLLHVLSLVSGAGAERHAVPSHLPGLRKAADAGAASQV